MLVTVGGEIDLATAPTLTTALRDLVAIPGGGHTVIDLRAVSFLAACGVRALAVTRDHAATTGTTMSTTAGTHSVVGRALALLGWVHDPCCTLDTTPTQLGLGAHRDEPTTVPCLARPTRADQYRPSAAAPREPTAPLTAP
ncbi:STAS domain-containing protein [Pseudonocardia parietis]|uniref:Anti-anti-sigma factor n=1 Tax=Pseudonocardia parietis TaxID=570936 RepID=A0ABS4W7M3_9PSEU|nr:STAS domain-containing protein [Pseudonocardia parietis]MBP2371948.1 anti-anti-sigma factor [Pseudonocardia parietis]